MMPNSNTEVIHVIIVLPIHVTYSPAYALGGVASLFLSTVFSSSCDLGAHSQRCNSLKSQSVAPCFSRLHQLRSVERAPTTIPANWVRLRYTLYVEHNLTMMITVTPYLSCSAKVLPNITDSCCVETYGGLLVSTQCWGAHTDLESQGQLLPRNAWTLHGLWPDFCNSSFTQYCDLK
jgi:hypothetical protein